jgi:hypothetical protein
MGAPQKRRHSASDIQQCQRSSHGGRFQACKKLRARNSLQAATVPAAFRNPLPSASRSSALAAVVSGNISPVQLSPSLSSSQAHPLPRGHGDHLNTGRAGAADKIGRMVAAAKSENQIRPAVLDHEGVNRAQSSAATPRPVALP